MSASCSGIDRFAIEYVSPKAIGEDGYLAKKGLVTLPKAEADAVRKSIARDEAGSRLRRSRFDKLN